MSPKKILIVEDDPSHLALWKRILTELNLGQFQITDSALEAEKILKRERIDFLISDIMMPKMNGYDLAKKAREKNHQIEILLTTAYGANLSRFNIGALKCHLLHKPYRNINSVVRLVQHLLTGNNPSCEADENSFKDNCDHPEVTEWTL